MTQKIQFENGKPVHIEWRCDAIVQESSHDFAKELQEKLNAASNDGFSLVQMMGRSKDDGLVLVHQKATILESGTNLPEGQLPVGTARLQ